VTLNLVPVIDAMVTLIGFLLFTTSVLAIVTIESPLPTASAEQNEQIMSEKPLQLTLSLNAKEATIWSPFDLIASKTIPNLSPGTPDVKTIHSTLLEIKRQFPTEQKIVFVPTGEINYDNLISVMDASRSLEKTDPTLYYANPASGNNEVLKTLFPNVIFGNLLGVSG